MRKVVVNVRFIVTQGEDRISPMEDALNIVHALHNEGVEVLDVKAKSIVHLGMEHN